MGGSIKVEIKGLDEMKKKGQALTDSVKKGIVETMYQGAMLISDRAKVNLTDLHHVKTGNLRRSMTAQAGMEGDSVAYGISYTDVFYGKFVEALPDGGYFYRASREMEKTVEKHIQDSIREMIDQ